jgi:hypothetical protein
LDRAVRRAAVLLLALLSLAVPESLALPPSHAAPSCPTAGGGEIVETVAGEAQAGLFDIGADVQSSSQGSGCNEERTGDGPQYVTGEACPPEVTAVRPCFSKRCGPGESSMLQIPIVDGVRDEAAAVPICVGPRQPAVTSAAVLREIKRIGLPTPQLSVQPPGGKTLVNLETIFSTDVGGFRRRLTVASIPVEVHVWPASYAWHFGDDEMLTTTDGGRPWAAGVPMEDFLTHVYDDAGVTVHPSVDVTYAAEFRVRRGAWQPVVGTVTIDGASTNLRIVEARPVLVGSWSTRSRR